MWVLLRCRELAAYTGSWLWSLAPRGDKPSMVVHAYNPSTWNSEVQDHSCCFWSWEPTRTAWNSAYKQVNKLPNVHICLLLKGAGRWADLERAEKRISWINEFKVKGNFAGLKVGMKTKRPWCHLFLTLSTLGVPAHFIPTVRTFLPLPESDFYCLSSPTPAQIVSQQITQGTTSNLFLPTQLALSSG